MLDSLRAVRVDLRTDDKGHSIARDYKEARGLGDEIM